MGIIRFPVDINKLNRIAVFVILPCLDLDCFKSSALETNIRNIEIMIEINELSISNHEFSYEHGCQQQYAKKANPSKNLFGKIHF